MHGDLSPDLQNKLKTRAWKCAPVIRLWVMETDGLYILHWPSSLAKWMHTRLSVRARLKNTKVRRD